MGQTQLNISVIKRHAQPRHPYQANIYIGRGTALGAPIPILVRTGPDQVIASYEVWLRQQMAKSNPAVMRQLLWIADEAVSGRQVNLVCFCPRAKCHGDIIKQIVCEALAEPEINVRSDLRATA